MAESYYKVTKIEGKDYGVGCVATLDIPRGSLILTEKIQFAPLYRESQNLIRPLRPNHPSEDPLVFANLATIVVDSFFSMNEHDQEEYLKLGNTFSNENPLENPLEEDNLEVLSDPAIRRAIEMKANKKSHLIFADFYSQKFQRDRKLILEILGIYNSNFMRCGYDFIAFKASRFNHSCR